GLRVLRVAIDQADQAAVHHLLDDLFVRGVVGPHGVAVMHPDDAARVAPRHREFGALDLARAAGEAPPCEIAPQVLAGVAPPARAVPCRWHSSGEARDRSQQKATPRDAAAADRLFLGHDVALARWALGSPEAHPNPRAQRKPGMASIGCGRARLLPSREKQARQEPRPPDPTLQQFVLEAALWGRDNRRGC